MADSCDDLDVKRSISSITFSRLIMIAPRHFSQHKRMNYCQFPDKVYLTFDQSDLPNSTQLIGSHLFPNLRAQLVILHHELLPEYLQFR